MGPPGGVFQDLLNLKLLVLLLLSTPIYAGSHPSSLFLITLRQAMANGSQVAQECPSKPSTFW